MARMILVVLTVLALYGAALLGLQFVPGADIVQVGPISWTGVFLVAVAFAGWNVWDSLLDARSAYRRHATKRVIAGGLWRLRSDTLQGACCTAMAGAGALAIVQWGTVEIRAAIIASAGVLLVINQIWNRADRERIQRMPGAISEARAMELLAIELAADVRMVGHDLNDNLQVIVGALEVVRQRPDLSPTEAGMIDAATSTVMNLAAHVRVLHEHAKERDPSLRGQP